MIKNIELLKDWDWARREFNKLYPGKVEAYVNQDDKITTEIRLLNKVQSIFDQIDKPETLSQEWIDKNVVHVRGLGDIIEAEAVKNILVPEQEITFEQVYDKLREESILSEKSFDYYWNCISDNVEIDEPGNLLVPKQEITYEDALKAIAENIGTDEFSIGLYLEALNNNEKYEFLTEKWIEDNTSPVDDEGRLYVWKRDLQNVIVPKQEELEVKIQELIEAYKQEDGAYSNPENGWIGGFIEDLKNLLEEEQKYYIRDQHGVYLLAKNHREQGKVQTVAEIVEQYGIEEIELDYELTEQEIKEYDPRYWAFAKPIEELEE